MKQGSFRLFNIGQSVPVKYYSMLSDDRTPRAYTPEDFQRKSTCLINAASSTGRCHTIKCVDSTMLPRRSDLFGCTRSKPSQGSVPGDLTLASD